jgi:hypothetical protein
VTRMTRASCSSIDHRRPRNARERVDGAPYSFLQFHNP